MRWPSQSSSGANSRHASFEVYVFRRGRWVVDSIHDHRNPAIEEAKRLLERARGLAAARVVAVEQRGDAFRESVVFYGSSTLAPVAPRRPMPVLGPMQPAGVPLAAAATSWPTSRIVLMLALILVTATLSVLNRRNEAQPWVFDTPEAQRPNAVSMPWGR